MTKKVRDNSSAEQRARNTLELSAWNEWKEICSILGCTDVYKEALKDRMWTSAQEKLGYLLEGTHPDWKKEYSEEGWKDEISKLFDDYIHEGVENASGRRLNYKDTIWKIIEDNKQTGNNDAPLKVIRGKLTAPKRVLDGVLERLVQKKGWTLKVLDHKSIGVDSLNEKRRSGDEDDGDELIDNLPARSQPVGLRADDRLQIVRILQEEFSFKECVLLMAYIKKITLADVRVTAACGVGKSTTSSLFYGKDDSKKNKHIPGVLERFAVVMAFLREIAGKSNDWGEIKDVLIAELEKQIRMEKPGVRFLSEIGMA